MAAYENHYKSRGPILVYYSLVRAGLNKDCQYEIICVTDFKSLMTYADRRCHKVGNIRDFRKFMKN
jgi:hypothetical protein